MNYKKPCKKWSEYNESYVAQDNWCSFLYEEQKDKIPKY